MAGKLGFKLPAIAFVILLIWLLGGANFIMNNPAIMIFFGLLVLIVTMGGDDK